MIDFNSFELSNGLRIYVHEDPKSLTVAFNLCYNVGSRDEDPEKTGFAHLFEHLMFGGSRNIPSFDEPLQKAGGSNNAFTSPDLTNYYITIPYQNLETAFWLESDRMLGLSFDPKVLQVQKDVVIEEYKQRYLNQPYGDLWLKFRPLIYRKHPYSWPTIGKEISHIENATLEDVKAFFFRHYLPNNAVLVLAGNVTTREAERLAKKWFGGIPAGKISSKAFPSEPTQVEARHLTHEAKVPVKTLYKAYHTPKKYSREQYALDLFSDILGKGNSSILYQNLVKDTPLFTGISTYHMASHDSSLFLVSGAVKEDISLETADAALEETIENSLQAETFETKLSKAKTQAISIEKFNDTQVLHRAMKLAFSAIVGDASLANQASAEIASIDQNEMVSTASAYLSKSKSNTLYYIPTKE